MSTLKVDGIRSNSASSDAITLASDGTCTANITNNLSNRNKVINGGMIVKQRADLTMTTSSTYSLDRFRGAVGSSFNWSSATVTQSTTSPDGFGNSLKVDIASTNTPTGSQNALIQTKIEGQDLQDLAYGTSSAKQCILSFYVRSNKTGTYCVQIANTGNTKYVLFEYTINSADTWERKSVTFSGNTANTLNNDNALGFDINFHLATGSDDHASATSTWTTYTGGSYKSTSNQVNLFDNASNEWYLTGVQLEVDNTGSGVATDFEHRSYAQELQLCRRYYHAILGKMGSWGSAVAYSTQNAQGWYSINPEMRASPTFSFTGTLRLEDGASNYNSTYTSASTAMGPHGFSWWAGGFTGLPDNYVYYVYDANQSGYFQLDAEL